MLDKSLTYTIYFDEEMGAWICNSEDLQYHGVCYEESFTIPGNESLAAGVALLSCGGYDDSYLINELDW